MGAVLSFERNPLSKEVVPSSIRWLAIAAENAPGKQVRCLDSLTFFGPHVTNEDRNVWRNPRLDLPLQVLVELGPVALPGAAVNLYVDE
jgi:hypothetical protein